MTPAVGAGVFVAEVKTTGLGVPKLAWLRMLKNSARNWLSGNDFVSADRDGGRGVAARIVGQQFPLGAGFQVFNGDARAGKNGPALIPYRPGDFPSNYLGVKRKRREKQQGPFHRSPQFQSTLTRI